MKPKAIKARLKQLGYHETKYYEIKYFLSKNRIPMKAITRIEYYDEFNCHVLLDVGGWVEA